MAPPLTLNLSQLSQGWYMTWQFSTQSANNVQVTLKDDTHTYVDNAQRQNTTFGVLSEGFQQIQGSNLQLIITVPDSRLDALLYNESTWSIDDPQDRQVGEGYAVTVEDSTDYDYNDFCATITAWKSAG